MLLDGVQIVLVKTRFRDKYGTTARAGANLGGPAIRLGATDRGDR